MTKPGCIQDHSLVRSARDIEFDVENGCCRLRYDPSVDDTSFAVVSAVSAVSRGTPTDLGSLHDTGDTSALDSQFAASDGGTRGSCRVPFEVASFEVPVESDGIVEVVRRQCS